MIIQIYNWQFNVVEIEIPDDKWGEIIYAKKTIHLKQDLHYDLKRQTLIHEIVHAIQYFMGYNEQLGKEETCNFIAAHFDVISKALNDYFGEVKE